MRRIAIFLVALMATCVAVVVSVSLIDSNTELLNRSSSKERQSPPPPEIRPAEGQAFLRGSISNLVAVANEVPVLATPLTISAAVRGTSKATIENALVGNKRTTISWGGGTPLPIRGGGGIDMGTPVKVEVRGSDVIYTVDGGARAFVPGEYVAGAPVGVGATGLASPRDNQTFTADEKTVLQSTSGVVITVPLQQLTLKGPGRIQADGRIEVQYPAVSKQVGKLEFGEGKYELTLSRSGSETTITAVLEGPVHTS